MAGRDLSIITHSQKISKIEKRREDFNKNEEECNAIYSYKNIIDYNYDQRKHFKWLKMH